MCSYSGKRGFSDETNVCRARSWVLGFRLKLLTQLVKVELLLAKPQSLTISLENAKRACVDVWRLYIFPNLIESWVLIADKR